MADFGVKSSHTNRSRSISVSAVLDKSSGCGSDIVNFDPGVVQGQSLLSVCDVVVLKYSDERLLR